MENGGEFICIRIDGYVNSCFFKQNLADRNDPALIFMDLARYFSYSVFSSTAHARTNGQSAPDCLPAPESLVLLSDHLMH